MKKATGPTNVTLDDLASSNSGRLQGSHPDRRRTNESLRVEREKTDQAVAVRQRSAARHADAVVHRARDNADAVLGLAREQADTLLDAARDKADELLDPGTRHPEPQASLIGERVLADEALRGEREHADETLRGERENYARALSRFLPMERDSTDRYLRSERVRSDDAVANRDDFLAIVAHDLRDLIGGIVLSARVLSKTAPDNEQGKIALEEAMRIERHAARMKRLIGDLVDVASIDAGKLAVLPAITDLVALIAEAEDAFRATALAKGISIDISTATAPLLATIDHERILQVLANLISNSLKFTPRGGAITIVGEREADNLRLSVVDTGSGIPDHALASVFERFSQAGESDRRGLGLGLYLSRCLVEAHGGRIWAERRPSGGSRVCFTLPATA